MKGDEYLKNSVVQHPQNLPPLGILNRQQRTQDSGRSWNRRERPRVLLMTSRVSSTEGKFVCDYSKSQLKRFPRYSGRRHLERRTWKQRLTRAHQNWNPVLPSLVKLYMYWKYAVTATHPPSPMVADPPLPTPSEAPPERLQFFNRTP